MHPSIWRPRSLRFSLANLQHRSLHISRSSALRRAQLRPQLYTLYSSERVLTHNYTTATMALNAASHNIAGEKTGPVTAAPPAVSDESKKELLEAANTDGTGQSAPGRENEKGVEKKEKTAKELEKERKKAEKDAKFKAKKAAQGAAPAKEGGSKKEKKKGKEEEVLPDFKEETPKGEKKRLRSLEDPYTKAYIPKVVESAWCKSCSRRLQSYMLTVTR
jgi:hypothetical protein